MISHRKQLTAICAIAALVTIAGCKGNSAPSQTTPNGATDPGITKTSITVGTIADLTGPVPGIFQGATYGVQAYLNYINSQGGVDGRQIKDDVKDSALSCSQDAAGATSLAGSAFALVGSFALYDACSVPVMQKNPTVPYVATELSADLGALPNVFNSQPILKGFRTGPDTYIHDHYGVSRIAFLAGQGAQEPVEKYQMDAAKAAGATLAYVRFVSATETDFTADVIRMRNAHVDWVNLGNVNDNDVAAFLENAAQQHFHPKVIQAATTYDGKFLGLLTNPALANGVLIDQTYAMFLGEDAATVPGVKLFDTWMTKTKASFKPDLYALYGWTSAELFVQALKAAGPNPTRATVIDQLKKVHDFNADGLLAPSDPGGKGPTRCWILVQIENSKFNRVFPKTGFSCKPNGYYFAPK